MTKTFAKRAFFHYLRVSTLGLASWVPIAIILYVGWLIVVGTYGIAVKGTISVVGQGVISEALAGIIGLAVLVVAPFISGLLLKIGFIRFVHHQVDKRLSGVVGYKSVRDTLKQLADKIIKGSGSVFKGVAIVRSELIKGGQMLAFIVEEDEDGYTVDILTSPSPTNGYNLWVSRQNVFVTDISTEQALQATVGLGMGLNNLIKQYRNEAQKFFASSNER